jgi:hypothetical protein
VNNSLSATCNQQVTSADECYSVIRDVIEWKTGGPFTMKINPHAYYLSDQTIILIIQSRQAYGNPPAFSTLQLLVVQNERARILSFGPSQGRGNQTIQSQGRATRFPLALVLFSWQVPGGRGGGPGSPLNLEKESRNHVHFASESAIDLDALRARLARMNDVALAGT